MLMLLIVKNKPPTGSVKFHPILDGSMMYSISCEWISKNDTQFNIFLILKAKKQGFHLTPIRTIIVHEQLRKYGTNISGSTF